MVGCYSLGVAMWCDGDARARTRRTGCGMVRTCTAIARGLLEVQVRRGAAKFSVRQIWPRE